MNKEEITKEDILNVTGSMFDTMFDYVENSDKEIEQLEQENKQLKEKLNEIQELLDNKYNYHCETCLLLAIQDVIEGGEEDE